MTNIAQKITAEPETPAPAAHADPTPRTSTDPMRAVGLGVAG